MRRAALVAVMVVLAGCSGLSGFGGDDAQQTHEDPQQDQLGWENGYWYNDSIAVNASDGLDESEREAVVSRAMARLEQLRGLEFEERVPVEVISREEYRNRDFVESNATHSRWNNQVWEALLLVGEDRNITKVFEETYGGAVAGYYSPEEDQIVIVSDSDEPTIRRSTLVHELVHALQDQHFDIAESPPTQDGQLARNGVVEGEATLLEQRYLQRCGQQWDCIESQPNFASGGSIDSGVLSVISYPYVVGPRFVGTIQERDGWDAVDGLHEQYPQSTEQVTNESLYPENPPSGITVPDRSSEEWERFDHDPVADTAGQASIHVMLQENGQASGTYVSPATDGWGDDRIVPYHDGDRYGYVWELEWDSRADAREFQDTYISALFEYDPETRAGGVYVVPESSTFGDAFRVTREGSRVRIVNAPTVEELDEIHDSDS